VEVRQEGKAQYLPRAVFLHVALVLSAEVNFNIPTKVEQRNRHGNHIVKGCFVVIQFRFSEVRIAFISNISSSASHNPPSFSTMEDALLKRSPVLGSPPSQSSE